MESIYNFLKEKQINHNNLKFLLQFIANEIINGNKNVKYGNDIELCSIDPTIPMLANVDVKKFSINILYLNLLNKSLEDRLVFTMLFLHECRHMLQREKYNKEKDLINQFYLYLNKYDASQLNKFDNLNHDYYYTEIDAHLFALKIIDNLKKFNVPSNVINNAKNKYKEIYVQNLKYNQDTKLKYFFNDKKREMTIGEIELYKALIIRNNYTNGVSKLFLELTPCNKFQTMNENIEFLTKNYHTYGERLEGVILHIEKNKIIEKQEIFYDVINLLQNYFNPNSFKLSFYEKIFELKINQLIRIKNSNEELDNIINYLASLRFYYSNINQKFSYYLANLLDQLIEIKEKKILTKKY